MRGSEPHGTDAVHVWVMSATLTTPDPAIHFKKIVEGEIEVCAGCINSLGYNVAWEFAEPDHIDPVALVRNLRDAGSAHP